MDRLRLGLVLAALAARNVWLHRSKSLAIASLLGFGTTLIVIGFSILKKVESTMQESIIGSVSGHLQVYAAASKDELALFGGSFMGREDIGMIPDYAPVAAAVRAHPNVKDVVPMGFDTSILGRGNELDDLFAALRTALRSSNSGEADELVAQSRQQIAFLKKEITQREHITALKDEVAKELELIKAVETDSFWSALRADPEQRILQLEARIAPLSGEKSPIWLRYLGTDMTAFGQLFPKFRIVEGEAVPPGTRGILLSHRAREDWLKSVPARLLDKLKRRTQTQGLSIALDPESKRLAGDLTRQHMEIIAHLNRRAAAELKGKLADYLKLSADTELAELVKSFLTVDDTTIVDRHAFFYSAVAPRIRLYEISPGETLTLRTYTRSGYIKSLNVKVFGIFTFEGIEDSDLAGAFSILDLVSFRDLYGQMSEAALQELDAMRKDVNVKQVGRETAEDELFGSGSDSTSVESEAKSTAAPESMRSAPESAPIDAKPELAARFDPAETGHGLALNMAIILKDPTQLATTKAAIEKTFKDSGMALKVVDWKGASGYVGQFVDIVRSVLLVSVSVIMLVALIIINNTLIVAVFDRIREIGTMRAIGAQKSLIAAVFLAETAVIGAFGAIPGALLGAAVIKVLSVKGIPAMADVIVFLFSGPRLYPHLDMTSAVLSPLIIVTLAVLSSLYAALFAAKVKPSEAMQEKE